MELHAVQPAYVVLERGHRRVLGLGNDARTLRRRDDGVAMRHPRGLVDRLRREQALAARAHRHLSVLAGTGLLDTPAELEREQLRAVTDAERRDPLRED